MWGFVFPRFTSLRSFTHSSFSFRGFKPATLVSSSFSWNKCDPLCSQTTALAFKDLRCIHFNFSLCVLYHFTFWDKKIWLPRTYFQVLDIYTIYVVSNHQNERSDDIIMIKSRTRLICLQKPPFVLEIAFDFYEHPNLMCNVIQHIGTVFSVCLCLDYEIMIRKDKKTFGFIQII